MNGRSWWPMRHPSMPLLPVVLALAVTGCAKHARSPTPEPAKGNAGPIELLETHRGATALWHDGDLWVSWVQDWDRPSEIRMSRGNGPIERKLDGWVAGARGGRAYVLVPNGSERVVESIGLTGEAAVLGSVPAIADYRYQLALTATGEVVVAGGVIDQANDVVIIGPEGTRRFPSILLPGDAIFSLAADPTRPRIALVLNQVSGTPEITRGARLLVVDTDSGAVLSEEALAHLSAIEGEAAFANDGALWLHLDKQLIRYQGTGKKGFPTGNPIDARNLIFAPDGSAIAYTEKHGGNDMMPLTMDRYCAVYYLPTENPPPWAEPDRRFDGDCYFGLGLAIVDGTLWITPP